MHAAKFKRYCQGELGRVWEFKAFIQNDTWTSL